MFCFFVAGGRRSSFWSVWALERRNICLLKGKAFCVIWRNLCDKYNKPKHSFVFPCISTKRCVCSAELIVNPNTTPVIADPLPTSLPTSPNRYHTTFAHISTSRFWIPRLNFVPFFTQLYEQSRLPPDSTVAGQPSEPTGVAKRSLSAVEVMFANELERSRPLSRNPAFSSNSASPKLRSMSTSGAEHRGRGAQRQKAKRRLSPSAQHLVLLYPNTPHLQFHPVLPTFPLAAHPYLFQDHTSSSLDRLPQTHHHSVPLQYLPGQICHSSLPTSCLSPQLLKQQERLHLADQGLAESRLYPRGGVGLRAGMNRKLELGRVEAGHYSDDSTFHTGLPRRASSQPDVKFQRPTLASNAAAYASEYRPLGYYPHLSRHQIPTRPTYLPLSPAPLPERPTSLCVLGTSSYSDSDSDTFYPYFPALGKVVRSGPLARMRISSGSLQLDEEDGEDEEEEEEECQNEQNTTLATVKVMKL